MDTASQKGADRREFLEPQGNKSPGANKASECATGMASTVGEKIEQLKDSAADIQEQAQEKLRNAQVAVQDYISEQPLSSVLVALVLGCFLGALLARSRRD